MTNNYPEHIIEWQMAHMDCTRDVDGNWIDGEPTREDAIAVLAAVEAENEEASK